MKSTIKMQGKIWYDKTIILFAKVITVDHGEILGISHRIGFLKSIRTQIS